MDRGVIDALDSAEEQLQNEGKIIRLIYEVQVDGLINIDILMKSSPTIHLKTDLKALSIASSELSMSLKEVLLMILRRGLEE